MKLRLAVLALVVLTGCVTLRNLAYPNTPEALFETAETAYTSALETAVGKARRCSNVKPMPTVECDDFILKLNDVNTKAQSYLLLGGLAAAGATSCDELAEPGCTGRQLRTLAAALENLAVELEGSGL